MVQENSSNPLVVTSPDGQVRNLATDVPYTAPLLDTSTAVQQIQGLTSDYLARRQQEEQERARRELEAQQAAEQQALQQQAQAAAPPAQQQSSPSAPASVNDNGALNFVPAAYEAGFEKWSKRTQDEYVDTIVKELVRKNGGTPQQYRKAVVDQFKGQPGSKVGRETEGNIVSTTVGSVMGGLTNLAKGIVGIGELITGDSEGQSSARRIVDTASDYWQQFYSEKQKDNRLELQEDIQRGNYGDAAGQVLSNPSLAASMAVESLLPSVVGAGKVRLGLNAVKSGAGLVMNADKARKVTDAVRKLESSNSIAANMVKVGLPSGIIGGGTTAYELADDSGNMTAEQRLAAITSIGINALLPSVASRYAPTLESAVVNGFRNTTGRSGLANAGLGIISEGVTEGVAEGIDATLTAAQGDRNNPNFSWQNVQDNKNQILGQAVVGATLGAITGGVVGGLSTSPNNVVPSTTDVPPNVDASQQSPQSSGGVPGDAATTPVITPDATSAELVATAVATPADNIDTGTLKGHAYDTIVDQFSTLQEDAVSPVFTGDNSVYNLEQIAQDAVAYPTSVEMLQNARDQLADIHSELSQVVDDEAVIADANRLLTTINSLDQAIAEQPRVVAAQQAKAEVQAETNLPTVDTLIATYEPINPRINGSTVLFDSPVDKLAAIAAGNTNVDIRDNILDTLAEQTGLTPEALLEYGRDLRKDAANFEPNADGTIQVPDSLGTYKNLVASRPDSQRYYMPDNISQDNIAYDYSTRPRASSIAPNPLEARDPAFMDSPSNRAAMPLSDSPVTDEILQTALEDASVLSMTVEQQLTDIAGPVPLSATPTGDFENPAGIVSSDAVRRNYRATGEIPARFIHERNWRSQSAKKAAAKVLAGGKVSTDFLYERMLAGVDAPARGVLYADYLYAAWLQDQIDAVDAIDAAARHSAEATQQEAEVSEEVTYTKPASTDLIQDIQPQETAPATYEPRSPYIQAIFDLMPDVETSILLGQASLINSELYPSTRAMLEGYEYNARQADEILRGAAQIVDDVVSSNPELNTESMARTMLNYAIQKSGMIRVETVWQARAELTEQAIKDAAKDLAYARDWAEHNGTDSALIVEFENRLSQAQANAAQVIASKPRDFDPTGAEEQLPWYIKEVITSRLTAQENQETPLVLLQEAAVTSELSLLERRIRSDVPGARTPDLDAYYTAMIHGDDNAKAAVSERMEAEIRDIYRKAKTPQLQATAALADIDQGLAEFAEQELDAMDTTTYTAQKIELLNNIADTVDHSMWTMLYDTVSQGERPMAHYLTSDYWNSGVARTRMERFDTELTPDPKDLYDALVDVYEVTRTEPEFESDARIAKVAIQVLRAADQTLATNLDTDRYLPAGPVPTSVPYLSKVDSVLGGYIRANDLPGAMTHMAQQFGENQMVDILARLYRDSPVSVNIDMNGNPVNVGGQPRTSHFDPATMTISFSNGAETIPYNVVHEILHAMTHYLMNAPASVLTQDQIAARTAISELYQEAQQNGAVVPYATNVEEFIAEAFSNPDQRAMLENYQSKVSGLDRIRSAWQGFTSFVRRLLGLKPGQHNALTDLMASTKTLLSPKPRARTSMGTGGASTDGARILRNTGNRQPIAATIYKRGYEKPVAVIGKDNNGPGFIVRTLDGSTADLKFNSYADAVNQFKRDNGYRVQDVVLSDRTAPDVFNTLALSGNEGASTVLKKLDAFMRRTFRVKEGSRLDGILLRSLSAARIAKTATMERFAILQELERITGQPIYEQTRVEIGQARADVGRYTGTTNTISREVNRALKTVGGTVDNFGDYLYALHVEERNKVYSGKTAPGYATPLDDVTGFTYTDPSGTVLRGNDGAKAFLASLDGNKLSVYQSLADMIHERRRDLLGEQLVSGMLDYGSYIALGGRDENGNIAGEAFKNYVPLLNRDRDTTVSKLGISGRTTHADNPFLALLEQMQQTRFRIANNNVGNALIDILMKTPIPQFASVDTVSIVRNKDGEIALKDVRDEDAVLYVMRGGKMHRVIFNTKTSMGRAGAAAFNRNGEINAATAAMTHVTSAMATLNTTASPAFMVKSYAWSLGSLLFNTQNAFDGNLTMMQANRLAFQSIPDIAKYTGQSMWFTTTRKDPSPLMTLYQQLGGGISGTSFAGADTVQRRLGTSWQDWGEGVGSGKLSFMDITQGATGRALHTVHEIMNSPEDAVRFSVFKNFIEFKAGQKFSDDAAGATAMQAWLKDNPDIARSAVLGSKKLTGDFEAKGTNQFLRGYFMFWNAGMQGSRMFAGALGSAQGFTAFSLLALAGSAVAIQMMSDPEDEDKDGLSKYARNRDRLTALRFNENLQMPLPYEARLAYGIGNTWALLSAGKMTEAAAYTSMITTARELFVPLPYGATGDRGTDTALMLMPSFAIPAVTGLLGVDHFRQDIDGKGIYVLKPDENGNMKPTYVAEPKNYERANYKTSDFSRNVANLSYDHLGLDVSPKRMDAVASSFLGGSATFFKDTMRPDYEPQPGFGGGVLGALTKAFKPAEDRTSFGISADYRTLQGDIAAAGRRDWFGLAADSDDLLNKSSAEARAKKIDDELKKRLRTITVNGKTAGYYVATRDAAAREGDEETKRDAILNLEQIYELRDQETAKAIVELRELLGTKE